MVECAIEALDLRPDRGAECRKQPEVTFVEIGFPGRNAHEAVPNQHADRNDRDPDREEHGREPDAAEVQETPSLLMDGRTLRISRAMGVTGSVAESVGPEVPGATLVPSACCRRSRRTASPSDRLPIWKCTRRRSPSSPGWAHSEDVKPPKTLSLRGAPTPAPAR